MAASSYSDRDLSLAPPLTFAFVDHYAASKSKASGHKHQSKGYKYFGEGYIHGIKVYQDNNSCLIKGNCHRSQRKNEQPHVMSIFLEQGPHISKAICNCTIGMGETCGHICGLLYTLALWKSQGKSSIPVDVAKTSLPQTWHVPRGSAIEAIPVDKVAVSNPKLSSGVTPADVRIIKSTLYDPINGPPPDWQTLHGTLARDFPRILALPAVAAAASAQYDMPTTFGLVPKGSVLSYQQQQHSDISINLFGIEFPNLPADNFMINRFSTVLSRASQTKLDSLKVSLDESIQFEAVTHEQSRNPLFYKLREHRLTASKIHRVVSRRDNFHRLAIDLKSTRKVQTAAMKRGIEMEPVAADVYCKLKGNDINMYPCGVIVNPWSHWLAASPDRKIYNPTRNPQFGLLEIKCPDKATVLEVPYLKKDPTGQLQLNRRDKYYSQIVMQLAVAGLPWCDFFVWTPNDHHLDTIYFDPAIWQQMKDKVDMFYLEYFL